MDIHLSSCLICKESKPSSSEHIIPQVLGGMLEAYILCKKCNNELGSELVSNIKKDPMFYFAIKNLKDEVPDIYKEFNKKSSFKGISLDGTEVTMVKKRDDLFVQPHKKNGVLEVDIRDGEEVIRKILNRNKQPPELIESVINQYRILENDTLFRLPTGHIVSKIPIDRVHEKIPTAIVKDKFWLLIAFEFLSLFLGDKSLDERLDPIRENIINDLECEMFEINHFQGGKNYRAIHVLQIEGIKNDTVITIRLFRWIVTKVLFKNIRFAIPSISYVEDLKNSTKAIALSEEDMRNGKWVLLR